MEQSISPRRERKQERIRMQILAAALEAIRVSGLEQLSLRAIAAEMDVTAASLYRYFDSKEAIVSALVAESLAQLRDALQKVSPEVPPTDRLVELGLAYLDFAAAHPVLFKLAFQEMPSGRPSLQAPAAPDNPYGILLEAARAAIGAGSSGGMSQEAAEMVAYSVWSLAHGMAVLEATHLRTFEADFARLHRIALERLVAGFVQD